MPNLQAETVRSRSARNLTSREPGGEYLTVAEVQPGPVRLFGGVEAGGTKFRCAVGDGPHGLLAECRIPTTTPEETLRACVAFFRGYGRPLVALGIASFGPLNLDFIPIRSETGVNLSSPPA